MSSPLRLLPSILSALALGGGCICSNGLYTGYRDGGSDGGSGGSGGGDAGTCAIASSKLVASPADIIIAIDQSASMGQEIDGVIANINTRLANILTAANVDYRVLLIAGDFCIQPPLSGSTTAPGCYASNPPRYHHLPAPVNSSDALTLFLWTYDGFYKTPNTCEKVVNPRRVRPDDHARRWDGRGHDNRDRGAEAGDRRNGEVPSDKAVHA